MTFEEDGLAAPPPGAGEAEPAAAARLVPLTDDLRRFLARTGDRPTSVGELLEALEERGTAVLIILMAAPFVLPLPLPGLSMPFGVAIALLGLRLGFRRRPWLPRVLLRRPIQPSTLGAIARGVERVARPIERLLRPRWSFMLGPATHALAGLAIAAAALILFPPFPMPLVNALPSLAIVLLALGLMERDGAAVAAGHLMLIVSYAYLYLWWDLVVKFLRQFSLPTV
jgi:hypothetical protein